MTLEERYALVYSALKGIATCATRCLCCGMHKDIAIEILAQVDEPRVTEFQD